MPAQAAPPVGGLHENAPDESLVLQLAHFLAVPGCQPDKLRAIEGADDGAVAGGHQALRDGLDRRVAFILVGGSEGDRIFTQGLQAQRLEVHGVRGPEPAHVHRITVRAAC